MVPPCSGRGMVAFCACLLVTLQLVGCVDESGLALQEVHLLEEGERGIVEEAIALGVRKAMASVRTKMATPPSRRDSLRSSPAEAPVDSPAAVVREMHDDSGLSKACHEAQRLKILGLTSMAATYAKQCAQEASAVLVDQQAPRAPPEATDPPVAPEAAPKAAPVQAPAHQSTPQSSPGELQAEMASMQQELQHLRARGSRRSRLKETQGLPDQPAHQLQQSSAAPPGGAQSAVQADLMRREAAVIAQEATAKQMRQQAAAAQAQVVAQQQAAKQALDDSESKAAAEEKRVSALLGNAKDQAARETLQAHRQAARVKQEAEHEAHDLQAAATDKVRQMETAALAHAQQVSAKASTEAAQQLAEAAQQQAKAKAEADAAHALEKRTELQKQQEKEALLREEQHVEAQEQTAAAKLLKARQMEAQVQKEQKQVQQDEQQADEHTQAMIAKAKAQAQATLSGAQKKLAKVAAEEEGEELKVEEDESKARTRGAEILEHARRKAVERSRHMQRQATRDATQVHKAAMEEARRQKEHLATVTETTLGKLEKKQAALLKKKTELETNISEEKAAASAEIRKLKQQEALAEDADKAKVQQLVDKAHSDASKILADAKQHAEERTRQKVRKAVRAQKKAEAHAKRIVAEASKQASQDRAREARMDKRAQAAAEQEANQLQAKAKLAADKLMQKAQAKAGEMTAEAKKELADGAAKEQKTEAEDRVKAQKEIHVLEDVAKKQVAHEVAAARKRILAQKKKEASELADVEESIHSKAAKADARTKKLVHTADEQAKQERSHEAASAKAIRLKAQKLLQHAKHRALELQADAERAASSATVKAGKLVKREEQHAAALESRARAISLHAKSLERAVQSKVLQSSKEQATQVKTIKKALRRKIARVAAQLKAVQQKVHAAKSSEAALDHKARGEASRILGAAKAGAARILVVEQKKETAMQHKMHQVLQREKKQFKTKQHTELVQLNKLKAQRAALVARVHKIQKQLKTQQHSKVKQLKTQQHSKVKQSHLDARKAVQKAVRAAKRTAAKQIAKVQREEHRAEKAALGEATAAAAKTFKSKEHQIMALAEAIQHKTARQVRAAQKRARSAVSTEKKEAARLHKLAAQHHSDQQALSHAKHVQHTTESHLSQAGKKIAAEEHEVARLTKKLVSSHALLQRQQAQDALLKQEATKAAGLAMTTEAHLEQQSASQRGQHHPRARSVERELSRDSKYISQLTQLEPRELRKLANPVQPKSAEPKAHTAKQPEPGKAHTAKQPATAQAKPHAEPAKQPVAAKAPEAHKQPATANTSVKQASKPASSPPLAAYKPVSSPRVTRDQQTIRLEHARILEWRASMLHTERDLKQEQQQQQAWATLSKEAPAGPQRTKFEAHKRAVLKREHAAHASLAAWESHIRDAEKTIRSATHDAASPEATAPTQARTGASMSKLTVREHAAAARLKAEKKPQVSIPTGVLKTELKEERARLGQIKVDEGSAEDRELHLKKAEKVWVGFVSATRGATASQFEAKLDETRAKEREAGRAVDKFQREIVEETRHLNHLKSQLKHQASARKLDSLMKKAGSKPV